MARSVLYVYHGEGADENARDQLYKSLQSFTNLKKHIVMYITPKDITKGHWTKDAALLAIGGGYDLGLIRALGDEGIETIQKYVCNGGSYFGLCSGAYFASDHIEFDKGGPLEVSGERHLKFFPGLCTGPVFQGFEYKTFKGAVAAPMDFCNVHQRKIITFHTYFNGGGLFQPYKNTSAITKDLLHPNSTDNANGICLPKPCPKGGNFTLKGDNSNALCHSVEILGRFSSVEGCPAAIVKTKFGQGKTVLSSVHIEYDIDAFPENDPHVDKMMDNLKASVESRKECFLSLLRHLNISVRDDL